jgi:aarF domain-containing kinase
MFRFQNVFRHNSQRLYRLLHHQTVKTVIFSSIAVSYTQYQLSTVHCDPAPQLLLPPTVLEEKETLILVKNEISLLPETDASSFLHDAWYSLMNRTSRALRNLGKAVTYMERIFSYMLYGAPLVGLVPANYFLGSSIPELENMTWGYLTWALQRLGPCFVKLAQWASTRPDVFPPALITHLEELQDKVKAVYPFALIEDTLTEAFGENWKDVLLLDPIPIGTGSVAQVFKGILTQKDLKNPEHLEKIEVAIKMIHPHVEHLIKLDMELFNHFANFLDLFPSLELLSLGESCREFSVAMKQQLDLRFEANHLISFTKKFVHEKWAVFPKPIEGFITKNVLIETLMEGTPINYFMKLSDDVSTKMKTLKMKLSDLGCRLILKMIFFDNYIHGDLHPGK